MKFCDICDHTFNLRPTMGRTVGWLCKDAIACRARLAANHEETLRRIQAGDFTGANRTSPAAKEKGFSLSK